MSKSSGRLPTIWCRWAERLPDGVLSLWVRQHTDKCAYCRSQQEAWEEVEAELRLMRRETAPPSLLGDVMVQIAKERAEGVVLEQPFLGGGNTGPDLRRQIHPDQISLLVFIGSWLLIILTVPQLLDPLSRVAGGTLATMRDTGDAIIQTSRLILSGIEASLTIGPLLLAMVWTGIGWAITLAVKIFADRVAVSRSE